MGYVTDYNLYANCSDLWQMALPPDTLFCDGGIRPGAWSVPTRTGTSSGTITLDNASNPIDDFSVVIQCLTGGSLNVDGVINSGPPPTFAISLDGGVTYSPRLTPQSQVSFTVANGTNIINFIMGGFRLFLRNGTTTIGSVNDSLIFSALTTGLSVTITQRVGTSLPATATFVSGLLTINLGTDSSGNPNSTPQAVSMLLDSISGVPQALYYVWGGSGLGIMTTASNTPIPLSYISGDSWAFTTSASPDCIRALSRSSRFVENYLQDTYQLPYTAWGDDLRGVVCEMARWYLIARRGLHQQQDMQAYEPKEAMKWLDNVAKGNIQPAIIEKNGTYLFPQVVHCRRRYEMDWRT